MSLSPQRKEEWIAPTLTASLLRFSIWWKRSSDRCDNKEPSCLCLDEGLLSSLLLPPLRSISSNPLWSHLLSLSSALHPTPLPPPSPSHSISRRLMLLAGVTLPFFVRASTIQSGDRIKNQRVSLSERHPGWCTLMSPWKFEIHMLSHFILVLSLSLAPSLPRSLILLSFCFLPFFTSSQSNATIMYYSVRRRESNGKSVKCIEYGFAKALSCLLFLMFLLCEGGGKI